MRKSVIILFVFVLVFCFVACDLFNAFDVIEDNQPSNNNNAIPTTLTVDLADIKGSSKTIEVGSNTLVSMENLKLEDGVFVDTSMLSRSIESRDVGSGSKNIFKTQGGGYMMVPDGNHHGEFHGYDLGIVDGVIKLAFRVFGNIDNDLAITSEEYPDVKPSDLLEEFYYVSFLDPKYSSLDPSRIVVVGPTYGGYCEFSVIQFGDYEQIKEGILDFSFYPGFGLYLYRAIGGNDGNNAWGNYCYVLNPLRLNASNNVSQTISNEVAVFDVDINDGQYYKITVHFDSFSDIDKLVGATNERYYNGETRDQVMIPVVDSASQTITYYLGAVDRPFLFTMDLSGADDAEFTFTCEASDQASFPGYVDLFNKVSDGSYIVTVPAGNAGNYYTFAFKITDTGYINSRLCNGTYVVKSYVIGKGSQGSYPIGNALFDNTTVTGYIITDCTYSSADDDLIIFDKDEPPMVDCPHMIWDEESEKYKCADGTCDVTYSYFDMFNLQRTSFDGWLDATVGGHNLSIRQLMNVNLDELTFGSTENSHGDSGEFANIISSNSDHTQRIQVSVKEMKTDEFKLVTEFTGDVFINVDSKGFAEQTFEDVTFTRAADAHFWAMSGDTAICTVCGEARNAASTEIARGIPCTLNISGLSGEDKLTVIVPSLGFEMAVANGSYNFPSPDARTIAYLIPPTPESSVSFTKSGSATYNIVISY